MKKFLLLPVFLLIIKTVSSQSFNSQLATMLQDTLNTYVSMISNIKGMSASVFIPGQGIWQGVAGESYSGHPITSGMAFGIASNSKLFISVAMLKLSEHGMISLDDSLHKWLPTYNNINPNITIRQLLNHTSGISDPFFQPPWMDTIMANPTRHFPPNEVLGWVGLPLFAPGTGFSYSNTNYILAGMIAQNASGYPISKIIRDSILNPLNLDSTFYDVEETEVGIIAHRWWNNVDYHDTSRVGLNSATGAAGSVFSNASEMVQWYHAVFNGNILNQASLKELTTFVSTSNPSYQYGLGLSRETTQGRTYWGHGGDTWGYKSKLIYDTCQGIAVCGLANSFPAGIPSVVFLLYRCVKNHIPGCSEAIDGPTEVCQGQQGVNFTVPPIPKATSYLWIFPNGASGNSNTNSVTVDFGVNAQSGNIIVYGINNYGNGGSAMLPVLVHPIPATPFITQNENVISSNATAGNQWYNSAGKITGETNQNYTVTATDDYFTIVTLSACSSDTSNVLHVIPTHVTDEENPANLKIYPVPFANELIIDMSSTHQQLNITIQNMLGEVIYKEIITEKTVFQTKHFSPGIYIIKVENGETIDIRKIIKK